MSSKSRKKVLLMGKSGSGKTSMRAIIFKSQLAADTRRLGATIDVESSQIKFLGGLRLDLWDCGGQDSFMDSHLTSQSSAIFRSVHSLIYIFDAESADLNGSDAHYFIKCLNALRDQNPISSSTSPDGERRRAEGPTVFVLLHKMDLVEKAAQATKFSDFENDISKRAEDSGWTGDLRFFGTSIWNETLYKAWSVVIGHLMPSLSSLKSHLSHFLELVSAREVVLFERTTFLVISHVTLDHSVGDSPGDDDESTMWDRRRFERISTMVKSFKMACSRRRSSFSSLSISTPHYTAVLDALTPETYILVVARAAIQPAALELNIKLSKPHFAKLETIGSAR
ncbi:hypothetical protein, variant [Microbotryum lychnidis-dioicae p1A1 Lamole]|uniref:GTP-binding protein n=1 Tax=Microbotryum lychnidis-dioicae (strain p1A1 Lamole / MvSl-1064) TaxID=683840 RepID=U5HFD0_USTV1|nr:hypothetical protein, variant [Microbotryum lychnidis-dioicae p1A1 Lamole]|eukprot:KDE03738.1 hypothetical protein, variant [Microbotryum lychnidis-dioicae p1A1 Lamole]